MNYLTLEDIHKQLRLENDFKEDDELLQVLGDSAESFTEAHLNTSLDDICAQYSGTLPPALYNAMLMLVDYTYDNTGSGKMEDVPKAYFILCAPWKKYSIA